MTSQGIHFRGILALVPKSLLVLMQWGKFEMRLCPLSEDSDAAETAELSDACLSQNPLTLADGSGPFYFPKVHTRAFRDSSIVTKYRLGWTYCGECLEFERCCLITCVHLALRDCHSAQGGNDVQFQIDSKWVLPQNVTCDRCVLQVRLQTTSN